MLASLMATHVALESDIPNKLLDCNLLAIMKSYCSLIQLHME